MKIIIDCSNLQVGGGIQVATSFINDLKEFSLQDKFVILLSPQMNKAFLRNSFLSNFQFIDIEQKHYSSIFKRARYLKFIEEKVKPDVVFTVFGPSYYKSNVPKIVGFAIPHLIYTDSPFFKSLGFVKKLKIKLLMRLKRYFFTKNSDALVFETYDSSNIFVKKYNYQKPTFVVNNTLNQIFLNKNNWKKNDFERIKDTTYILCLTANYPHKNLQIIPSIIDAIVNDYQVKNVKFVLSVDKEDLGFSDKYDNNIQYIGRVNLESIPLLYQNIDILFMPTLLEIFSTSYIEAMFMKKPIVASDMSFARDVCGDAALYCFPTDAKSYAKAIVDIMQNDDLKDDLIQKGSQNLLRFGTSKDRTEKYLQIIHKAINSNANKK